jgi:glycosyltransferase involved in cell wall biosynthesis
VIVNGRFLRAQPTGLHRVGRALLDAVREAGLSTEVIAPPGVTDPRVDRHVWAPPGRLGDHVFEQVSLPLAAQRRPILSLTNTGPLLAPHTCVAVHDLAMVVHPEWYASSISVYARLVVRAARNADRVITFSSAVARELEAVGVRPDNIRVIREAIDSSFRPADAHAVEQVRQRWVLTGPYTLMVGWAHPRKDLATALAAHREVVTDVPHQLVLVGGAHVTWAGVPEPHDPTVVQTGHVTDDELLALLTGAAALLYPSKYEGFGLPPLEAWACGTPALVSDLPVLRESTEERATFLPLGDIEAWAAALRRALAGEIPVPEMPRWTWPDAGRQLLAALPL